MDDKLWIVFVEFSVKLVSFVLLFDKDWCKVLIFIKVDIGFILFN